MPGLKEHSWRKKRQNPDADWQTAESIRYRPIRCRKASKNLAGDVHQLEINRFSIRLPVKPETWGYQPRRETNRKYTSI